MKSCILSPDSPLHRECNPRLPNGTVPNVSGNFGAYGRTDGNPHPAPKDISNVYPSIPAALLSAGYVVIRGGDGVLFGDRMAQAEREGFHPPEAPPRDLHRKCGDYLKDHLDGGDWGCSDECLSRNLSALAEVASGKVSVQAGKGEAEEANKIPHLVDALLRFEYEKEGSGRLLICDKNRFGFPAPSKARMVFTDGGES